MQLQRLTLLVALAAAAAIAGPAYGQAQPRLNVYVLRYVSNDGLNRQANIEDAVRDRLRLLAEQIARSVQTARYVERLKVTPVASAAGSIAEMRSRWRNARGDALLYMSGTVNPAAGGLVATSSIYIGDLGAPPLDNLELAKFALRVDSHVAIKDSHTFVTAYALLQDARANHQPKATIGAILAQLQFIYAKLVNNPYRLAELPVLKQAIDRAATEEGFGR